MLAPMELRRFDAVGDFLSVAEPFLVEREAEHNLLLGVASSITEAPEAYSGPPYLAVVTDRDRVVAAALRTPPFRLVLSEVDDPRAIGLLAADWPANELPDVLGPVEHVRAFVEARAALGGPQGTLEMSERVYQLTEVQPIPSIAGHARPATLDDRDLVIAWLEAFRLEAFGDAEPGSVVADADRWLARRGRSLHLWQDGDVVSLAGTGGRTPNGIRIGPVYTPPDARRRGYASALVAAISQEELDAGCRFCFLFTDLANPTANHIYQAIGYAPVRDVEAYVFAIVSADETTPLEDDGEGSVDPLTGQVIKGESPWPMAIAVVVLIVFALVSSSQLAIFPPWVLAAIEGVLLLALLLGDPGHIDRQTPWLRRTTILLIAVLLISTLGSTAILVYNLITNTAIANEPVPLLVAGAKVWLGNNVAFAFLYWGFDGGGPAARAHGMPQYPDLAFPQQTSPDLAPPGWRPQFIDYLYVGFTTANAFSPTDTMPMVPWAKIAMGSQALISFAIVGLIIARVVNLFQ